MERPHHIATEYSNMKITLLLLALIAALALAVNGHRVETTQKNKPSKEQIRLELLNAQTKSTFDSKAPPGEVLQDDVDVHRQFTGRPKTARKSSLGL